MWLSRRRWLRIAPQATGSLSSVGTQRVASILREARPLRVRGGMLLLDDFHDSFPGRLVQRYRTTVQPCGNCTALCTAYLVTPRRTRGKAVLFESMWGHFRLILPRPAKHRLDSLGGGAVWDSPLISGQSAAISSIRPFVIPLLCGGVEFRTPDMGLSVRARFVRRTARLRRSPVPGNFVPRALSSVPQPPVTRQALRRFGERADHTKPEPRERKSTDE